MTEHTVKSYEEELNKLSAECARMGGLTESQVADAISAVVKRNQDLATNEHLRERGYLVRLEHPEVGRRTHVGIPWTLGGRSSGVASPAPLRGTDTDAVLSKLLGYSTAKIDRLRNAGTLS